MNTDKMSQLVWLSATLGFLNDGNNCLVDISYKTKLKAKNIKPRQ